jgi:DNA-damage-inducible protein J
MATIQIRIDDTMKASADSLFASLGLDTATAVRMFIAAALERDGLPFRVKRSKSDNRTSLCRYYEAKGPSPELLETFEDIRLGRNLHGPFETAEEAVRAMMEMED